MKRVIFSEGKNDTIFLREILIKLTVYAENKIIFFDQDSQDIKNKLKFLEDHYFAKLEAEHLPYELLVKSEGGRQKVIDINISKFPSLCRKRYCPIMLIDLDGGEIEGFINDFGEKLSSRFACTGLTVESNRLHKIDDAVIHSMNLSANNALIGTIYVIGFYESLERVTGITDTSSDEEKRNLSRKYIEASRIHEIFTKALNIS